MLQQSHFSNPEQQESLAPAQRTFRSEDHLICALEDVSHRFGERLILDGLNLRLYRRSRLAVVGDNGAGKSTLLKIVAGTLVADSGKREVYVPGGLALADQDPVFVHGTTVQQVIDSYHHVLRELERLIAAISSSLEDANGDRYERLLAQLDQVTTLYESREGYGIERRLNRDLQQLQLGGLDRNQMVSSLSGGQRSRLALAAVFSSGAQLLLLDEPTNDLDDSALSWLEDRIKSHSGALLVVSHDRVFLQKFAEDILEVHQAKLIRYSGGYDGYLRAKERERIRQISDFESWKQELQRAQRLVETNAARVSAIPRKQEKAGFGHGAFKPRSRAHGSTSKVKQAKAKISDLQSNPASVPPVELKFVMPTPPTFDEIMSNPNDPLVLIQPAQRVQEPRLTTGAVNIGRGERWLVSGANGAGKTTLLRVLARELAVDRGSVQHAKGLKLSWLRQTASPLRGATVLEAFALALDEYLPDAWTKLASLGLLEIKDFVRPPAQLSVGEYRRLELAIAVSSSTELLLLDEPTNHLSPALVERLEEALSKFSGTVVTVTHDRRWRQKLDGVTIVRRLSVADGVVTDDSGGQ